MKKKQTKKHVINWKIFGFSFGCVILAAILGSFLTDSGSWYDSLKPSITPPDYVFPIVWTILFFLIALSFYLSLVKTKDAGIVTRIYAMNLVLNVLWSYLFFVMHKPFFSFVEIILLWLSIGLMILVNWRGNKISAYLLAPYLLWVSFAAVLNFLIAF